MHIKLQPSVLRWIRERAGLSQDDLAANFKVPADRVAFWEREGDITFSLAEKLAKKAHAHLGFLYLSEPLKEELPILDFRTLAGTSVSKPSLDLLDTLDEADRRQDWYRDYIMSEDDEPLDFVGSLSPDADHNLAAQKIRKRIGFQTEIREQANTWKKALHLQIDQNEESGVLVMRNSVVGSNTPPPFRR